MAVEKNLSSQLKNFSDRFWSGLQVAPFKIIAILVAGMFLCLATVNSGFARDGDLILTQRAGLASSQGRLSQDQNHLGLMFSVARAFHGPSKILNSDFLQRFSVLTDSFSALDKEQLWFPLVPDAKLRLRELSIEFDLCLFSKWSIRPCMGGGLSAVHVQSSIQDYQIYAAFPFEARFVYASPGKYLSVELGARVRSFQNRMEGFVAKHSDIMPFVGFGLFFAGR